MTNLPQFDLEAAKRGEPVVLVFDGDANNPRQTKAFLFAESGFMSAVQTADGSVFCFDDATGFGHGFSLAMAAPAIPEGFTPYDPNVPPPENAEEIEVIIGESKFTVVGFYDWKRFQHIDFYRVTKWKEAKPCLQKLAHDIAILTNNDDECKTIDAITVLLTQFADAIVQRAVDKIKEDRG